MSRHTEKLLLHKLHIHIPSNYFNYGFRRTISLARWIPHAQYLSTPTPSLPYAQPLPGTRARSWAVLPYDRWAIWLWNDPVQQWITFHLENVQYRILKRHNTEYTARAGFCRGFKALGVTVNFDANCRLLVLVVFEREKNVGKVRAVRAGKFTFQDYNSKVVSITALKMCLSRITSTLYVIFHFRNHYLALWAARCELFPRRTMHLAWRVSPGLLKVSRRFTNFFECLGWFMGLTRTQVRLIGLCLRFWAHSCSNPKAQLTEHEPS